MNLTFEEKSTWACLLSVLGIYSAYFLTVLTGSEPASMAAMLQAMIGTVIALIVIQIIFHIIIASLNKPEPEDERDRYVGNLANQIGYWAMTIGIISLLAYLLILGTIAESDLSVEISLVDMANGLLLVLVVSELVQYAAKLVLYRRAI